MTWPLSLPGVVAGTLLTFIPAAGDYVNASCSGDTDTAMIGNVIDGQFLDESCDYPTAAALSLIAAWRHPGAGARLRPPSRHGGAGLMATVAAPLACAGHAASVFARRTGPITWLPYFGYRSVLIYMFIPIVVVVVLLQQAHGPVQLHLEPVLPRRLEEPLRRRRHVRLAGAVA